jgi:hypothetical protein
MSQTRALALTLGAGTSFVAGFATARFTASGPANESDLASEAARGVRSPSPVPPARIAPPAEAPAAEAQQPTIEACVTALACDCPLPPPPDVDPSYLEPRVREWLDEASERCPDFAARAQILDCSEFPCMLMIGTSDPNGEGKSDPLDLACGGTGADPNVAYLGVTGAPGDFYHLWSFRPEDGADYTHREFVRASRMPAK